MRKYTKTYESFSSAAKGGWEQFYKGLKHEIGENKEMRLILTRYASGQKPTKEEISFIKEQSGDLLKMLGLGAVVALPGGTLLIPALVMGAKKVGVDLIPDGFKKIKESSMSEDEILNIIQDGKKIYVKYINGFDNHDKNLSYSPVDINNEGDISLRINGDEYTTKLEWVVGIDEVSHYEVEPEMTEPMKDPNGDTENHFEEDEEFKELLKDQGGRKGVIKRMKKKYNMDYSDADNNDKLYQRLKADRML
tara:strand:+ start:119606 stop:120355 length:750 start_codon:yes stop_codon:yes gene_type:complete